MNKCNVNHHYHRRRRLMLLVSGVTIVVVVMLLCGQQLRRKLVPGDSRKDLDYTEAPPSDGKNQRRKRFIIFNGTGVVKLVLGVSFPIILPDKKRSLNYFYNIQMQYTPPPRPVYWWSLYNTTTFAARKERSTHLLMRSDNSRRTIYKFIETMMQRFDQFASECLLKAICEIARAPLTEDLVGEQDAGDDDAHAEHEYPIEDDYGQNIYHALINAIFTPHLPNVDRRYWNARAAGSKGANCDELFAKCSVRNDWLKRFTRFI